MGRFSDSVEQTESISRPKGEQLGTFQRGNGPCHGPRDYIHHRDVVFFLTENLQISNSSVPSFHLKLSKIPRGHSGVELGLSGVTISVSLLFRAGSRLEGQEVCGGIPGVPTFFFKLCFSNSVHWSWQGKQL